MKSVTPAVSGASSNHSGLSVVCWGTRGSVPSPGPQTVRYGGNTSCVELRWGAGRRLILDAGTGIRALGQDLARAPAPLHLDLFLTHFHWDHIQGLPFFTPLQDPANVLRVHADPPGAVELEELLAGQMRDPYFPVRMPDLPARLEYRRLGGRWSGEDASLTTFPVRHAPGTLGFRVTVAGATVVYIPDDEPAGVGYPLPESWEEDLVEFVRGADLLLHDSMYTAAEYPARRGWGHGTFDQAVALARAAGVPRLLFFHHAPERTDAELDGIVADLRRELHRSGDPLQIGAAAEGAELVVPFRQPSGSPPEATPRVY